MVCQRSRAPPRAMGPEVKSAPPSTLPKPRLAIVSTYDELCGIAAYTRRLVDYLEKMFDIQVFDLDQYYMRSKVSRVRVIADSQIFAIAEQLADFDHVNIQLEFGTLGSYRKDILSRLGLLIRSAPSVSVTFHTILPEVHPPHREAFRRLFAMQIANAFNTWKDYRKAKRFRNGVYQLLRQAQLRKPVAAIVHTRHDARALHEEQRIRRVFHHPLCFLTPEVAQEIRASAGRASFAGLENLPKDARILGVFGFVSSYKGIAVAIKALQCLPDDYHLAIFGGLHPQEIRSSEDMNDHVNELVGLTHVGMTEVSELGRERPDVDIQLSVNLETNGAPALLHTPRDISRRVHFLGTQSDDSLARGMAICDAVILPYFERGQASSGPISIALEMGARIIASRNKTFLRFARYHPGRIEFFDVGNFLELAQRIQSAEAVDRGAWKPQFTAQTNAEIYRKAVIGETVGLDD